MKRFLIHYSQERTYQLHNDIIRKTDWQALIVEAGDQVQAIAAAFHHLAMHGLAVDTKLRNPFSGFEGSGGGNKLGLSNDDLSTLEELGVPMDKPGSIDIVSVQPYTLDPQGRVLGTAQESDHS